MEQDRLKKLSGIIDEGIELEVLDEGMNVKIGNDVVSLGMGSDGVDKNKFKKVATKIMNLLRKEYDVKDEFGKDAPLKVTIQLK